MLDPELETLFAAACDGSANAETLRTLHDRLKHDPRVLDAYLRYVDLHAALATSDLLRAGDLASIHQLEPSVDPLSRRFPRRPLIAAAAGLAVAALGGSLLWQRRRVSSNAGFARVAENAGAELLLDGQVVKIGQVLPFGRLRLSQGSIGLAYGRGVAVVLEAPAEFECRSPTTLMLHSGRLSAHVPPAATGFTVDTPQSRVIDRGTRFALNALGDAPTEVYVFEGKVDASSRSNRANERTLVTGQAANVSRGLEDRDLRDAAFVQPEELPSVVAALRAGQPTRWRVWRRSVEQDPALILYAALEPDQLALGVPPRRIKVVGTQRVHGRWPGKQCLDFNRPGDTVELDVGGERSWPQLTLSAWVRLDRLGEPYQSLYHTDGWHAEHPGQVHWMITPAATMRFALRKNTLLGAQSSSSAYPDSKSPVLPERGRWVHLATVYDSAARAVHFYLNGTLDNVVPLAVAHPAELGPARIGNWNLHDRKLSGRVDELVILGRALDAAEIRAAFEAGNPYR